MATIKSFTSLEQSRKLAEILPLESADMFYSHKTVFYNIMEHRLFVDKDDDWHLYQRSEIAMMDTGNEMPAWSLAALLCIMPKDESIDCSISFGYYNGKGEYIEKWLCAFEKGGETTDDFIETIDGDNPVDACVEMIIRLNELKML